MVEWDAPEHEYREKTTDWYWAIVIVSVAAASIAVIVNNVLFAALIVVAMFALIVRSLKKPEIINFRIDNRGVQIKNKLYTYSTLESFWMTDKTILIKSQKIIMPHIVIPFPENKGTEIHSHLSQYLEEEEQFESLAEKIMEYLGF